MSDIPSMAQLLVGKSYEMANTVVEQVCEQVLGRPVTIDDAKDFQLATNINYPGVTLIAYKGNPLGRMYFKESFTIEKGCTMSYIFEPINSFIVKETP